VILALFAMAVGAYLVSHERHEAVRKLDRTGRLLYPTAFAAYSLFVWLA